MKLFDIMKGFTKVMPPEDVDLIVCDEHANPDARDFEVVRFYKKGSLLKHEYIAKGSCDAERFIDHLENEPSAWELAPESGYYFLDYCPVEKRLKWFPDKINPLDSLYVIIDPLDDPGE